MLYMEDNVFKTVSGYVHKTLAQQINEIAKNEEKTSSEVVKQAVMDYVARYDDIEKPEALKLVLRQKEEYREIYAEQFLINEENKKISVSYKERTFLNFMDRQLAQVWYMNKDYYDDSELEDLLKNHIETFRVRAEYHGVEGHYKKRKEDPIHYAKKFLERNKKANSYEVDLT